LDINVEIGNEAAQFHIWECINVIFGTVYSVEDTEDLYTLFLTRVRAYKIAGTPQDKDLREEGASR
jgi:hypothetical protein